MTPFCFHRPAKTPAAAALLCPEKTKLFKEGGKKIIQRGGEYSPAKTLAAAALLCLEREGKGGLVFFGLVLLVIYLVSNLRGRGRGC